MNKPPWWWVRIRASIFFGWYDLWIGMYIDTKKRTVYICPIPMFGLKIQVLPYEEPYRPEEWA